MKKIAFYLLLIIGLISCKGEDGRDGLNGINGIDGVDGKDGQDGKDGAGANLVTKKITINQQDWILLGESNELGSYYYATVKVPELTEKVMNNGIKLAYIEPYDGVHIGIPYVLHQGAEVDGKEILWTQTYDCEYEVGYVTFLVTYSDFITNLSPGSETFHLLLNW